MHVEIKDLQEGKPYEVKCLNVGPGVRPDGMWWCGRTFSGWYHPDCYYSGLFHLNAVAFRSDDMVSLHSLKIEDIIDIIPLESAPSINGALNY
jgi:hypothetical protein